MEVSNTFVNVASTVRVVIMDEYSKRCIHYLLLADPDRLTKHVNALCGSNGITLKYMNVDDVEKMILDSTLDEDVKTEDSAIQCKKCKQRRVVFREVQSRSADEGASVYYFCKACLYRWTR